MNADPTDPGDQNEESPFIYGVPLRFEDDDADTTIRPSRYRDWMGPLRLQPATEAPEAPEADDQKDRSLRSRHLRLDDGEEWSVVDQEPAEEASPPPKTEREQDAP